MSVEPKRLPLETADLAAANRQLFESIFPGVIADGVLDVGRLSELLETPPSVVPEGRERFGLMWAGKKEAVQSLLAPSRGTLIPDLAESIEFDNAQNVFIEGDNLEVLKLLQKAYNDKVKLIYIDPPYNTGNDFVYNDDFNDGLRGYLEFTGQLDETGARKNARPEVAGRRHSGWLSMMYPRLSLARNLLTSDGVIAVSIDSNEVAVLRLVLDEIFGAENFLNTVVWVSNLKGRQIGEGGAVGTHEYILIYARSASFVGQFRGKFSELKELMPSIYKGDEYEVKVDSYGPYVTKNELYNTNSKFNEVTAPTMVFRIHYNPDTGEVRVTDIEDETTFPGFAVAMPHKNGRRDVSWHAWRWSRAKVLAEFRDLEFKVDGDSLRIWTKIRDVDGTALKDIVLGPSTVSGKADLREAGLDRVFETPKPISLLGLLVAAVTSKDDIVLDFFAGSGSTAHAVAVENRRDGALRRCISVNLPEPTPPGSDAFRAGFHDVASITLARLKWIEDVVAPERSCGLRTFRLASSNFDCQDRLGGDNNVLELIERTLLSPGVGAETLTSEALLKEGVSLQSPWARHTAGGCDVIVSDGVAFVYCLDVTDVVVSESLALSPRVIVFLEDGFAGKDAVKANAFTNAKNLGITMKTV